MRLRNVTINIKVPGGFWKSDFQSLQLFGQDYLATWARKSRNAFDQLKKLKFRQCYNQCFDHKLINNTDFATHYLQNDYIHVNPFKSLLKGVIKVDFLFSNSDQTYVVLYGEFAIG